MSAKELLGLIADSEGNLDLSEAVDTLNAAVDRLVKDGAQLDANTALNLFSQRLDHVARTLAEIIVQTQQSVIAAHAGISTLLTGGDVDIPEFNPQEQLHLLLLGFEVQRLGSLYDVLNEQG